MATGPDGNGAFRGAAARTPREPAPVLMKLVEFPYGDKSEFLCETISTFNYRLKSF